MLTPDEIRTAAVERILAVEGSCNSGQLDHADGVLRGLIWALTGTDPGTKLTTDMLRVFQLLGIEAEVRGELVDYWW